MGLRVKLTVGLALVATAVLLSSSLSAAPDKVTICHAAGQAGTTHFVEITASRNAIFGEAGHFYEDGTPRAGHEDDFLGPCDKK